MPKVVKTPAELLKQTYLCISDISRLLGVEYHKAKRIYALADDMDSHLHYRVEPRKVRLTSVCHVAGTSIETLREQFTREERTK